LLHDYLGTRRETDAMLAVRTIRNDAIRGAGGAA